MAAKMQNPLTNNEQPSFFFGVESSKMKNDYEYVNGEEKKTKQM